MADEKYGIATGYNSQLIQDYLKYSDKSIGAQRQGRQGVVDTSTSMMYDALGRMQLQTERDIAKRRIQAQRSGMTSSGLASLEMQNIMVGQMGAQQLAQQYRMETAGIESEFAGAEDAARAGLFEILNANRGQVAAVDAQRFSSSAVEQIRDIFPDATPQQLEVLSRRLLGLNTDSKTDKALLKEVNLTGTTTYKKYDDNTKLFEKDPNAKAQSPEVLSRYYKTLEEGKVYNYSGINYVYENGKMYKVKKV